MTRDFRIFQNRDSDRVVEWEGQMEKERLSEEAKRQKAWDKEKLEERENELAIIKSKYEQLKDSISICIVDYF